MISNSQPSLHIHNSSFVLNLLLPIKRNAWLLPEPHNLLSYYLQPLYKQRQHLLKHIRFNISGACLPSAPPCTRHFYQCTVQCNRTLPILPASNSTLYIQQLSILCIESVLTVYTLAPAIYCPTRLLAAMLLPSNYQSTKTTGPLNTLIQIQI